MSVMVGMHCSSGILKYNENVVDLPPDGCENLLNIHCILVWLVCVFSTISLRLSRLKRHGQKNYLYIYFWLRCLFAGVE